MAFVNPASAVIVGAVDSHHLLGLYLQVVLEEEVEDTDIGQFFPIKRRRFTVPIEISCCPAKSLHILFANQGL